MAGSGSFGPTFAISVLPTAIPSAIITGSVQGSQHVSDKSTDVLIKSEEADNALQSLQESIKKLQSELAENKKNYLGLDIFRNTLNNGKDLELFPSVNFTRLQVGKLLPLASQGVGTLVSNVLQTGSDGVIASKATAFVKTAPIKDLSQPSKLLENAQENFFACCKHFMQEIPALTEQMNLNLQKDFAAGDHSALQTHETMAVGTAHVSLGGSVILPSMIGSIIWDTVGTFLRNIQGSFLDSTHFSEQEKELMRALNQCVQSLNSEDKNSIQASLNSIDHLNQLISALTDINASINRTSDDLVVDAKPFSKIASFATIPLISALKLVVDSALGLMMATEAMQKKLNPPELKHITSQASSLALDGKPQGSYSQNMSSLKQRHENIRNEFSNNVAKNRGLQKSSVDESIVKTVGDLAIGGSSLSATLTLAPTELGSLTKTPQAISVGLSLASDIMHDELKLIPTNELSEKASQLEPGVPDHSSYSQNLSLLEQRFEGMTNKLSEVADGNQFPQNSADKSTLVGAGIASFGTVSLMSGTQILPTDLSGSFTKTMRATNRGSKLASDAIQRDLKPVESKELIEKASSLDEKNQNQKSFHSQNLSSLTQRYEIISEDFSKAVDQKQVPQNSGDKSTISIAGGAVLGLASGATLIPLLSLEAGGVTKTMNVTVLGAGEASKAIQKELKPVELNELTNQASSVEVNNQNKQSFISENLSSVGKRYENIFDEFSHVVDHTPYGSTDKSTMKLVGGGTIGTGLLLSELLLLPLELGILSKIGTDTKLGLSMASEEATKEFQQVDSKESSQEASSLNPRDHKSHSHSQNIASLTQRFKNINQALGAVVEANNQLKNNPSHASSALMIANSATLTTAAVSLLPLLLVELGSVVQESAAGVKFSEEVGSKQIVVQSKVVSQSDEKVGIELDNLFFEASKTKDALEMAQKLGNTSPFSLGLLRSTISGGIVSTLNGLLGAYSFLKESRTLPEKIKNLSKLGVEDEAHVREIMAETKKSHQGTSASRLSTSAPKNLMAESALESILNKVILTNHISYTEQTEQKERNDLNSTGLFSAQTGNTLAIGSTHFGEFLTGVFSTIAFLSLESGIGAEATFRIFSNTIAELILATANCQAGSAGPDKIKLTGESGTNLSFLSNALRLLAESESKELPSIQKTIVSTASTLESVALRSLTIFLLQSGILSDALNELTRQYEVGDEKRPKSVVKTKASAREEVLAGLAKAIKNRLNQIEGKQIPGLNKDMASQLQSLSKQQITSALISEMTLIEPLLVLNELSAAGSKGDVPPRNDKEALIDSSPSKQISIFSNMIQGFTLACIEAAKIEDPEPINQSLMHSHHSLRNSNKRTFETTGYLGLALVETIGAFVGRSFTLLNSQKVTEKSDEISKLAKDELEGNLELSTAQVKADSHLGQPISAIHSISALRSILTHLSAALKECADAIAIEMNKLVHVQESISVDFIKPDLRMHSSQAEVMHSLAVAFSICASLITRALATGSGLSFLHVISLGKIDEIQKLIHSQDESLDLHQNNSSQKSTKGSDSDISLVTGITGDQIVSSITNLVKILMRASLLGADVLLSVSKVLEILVLDVHPEQRLKLESQALCVPDVRSMGASKTIGEESTAASAIPIVSTAQLSVSKEDECLKSTMDSSFKALQKDADTTIDRISIFEDSDDEERESKRNKTDLKTYVNQIIKTLDPRLSNTECESLVKRFDKGGITLSRYHSDYCGVILDKEDERAVKRIQTKTSKMNNIHSTKALIAGFIDEMYRQYLKFLQEDGTDPLKAFNQSLGTAMTDKTKNLHKYIINSIATKLYNQFSVHNASLWNKPRVSFNTENFCYKYTVMTKAERETDELSTPLMQQAEIDKNNILKVIEARERRAKRNKARLNSTSADEQSQEITPSTLSQRM